MSKIRIGVMGCANIAQRLVIPAIKSLSQYFDLIAVASRTKEKAQAFGAMFNVLPIRGYQSLLDRSDIDAIYMPLPTGLHQEWIAKALNAGKHVIAEKSLTMNLRSAQELVKLAREKGALLMENFMFKYHRQHQIVWETLKNGRIGSPRLFRSQFGFPPLNSDNIRYENILGGGSLLDAGAYTVMASQWFFGSEQDVISAVLYYDPIKNVDIYGNVTLKSKSGIVSQLSFGFDNFYQCNYEFWGSKGRLFTEKAFTPKPNEATRMLLEKADGKTMLECAPDNHFANILTEFYRSIKEHSHEQHYNDILTQSKTLWAIREKSIKVLL